MKRSTGLRIKRLLDVTASVLLLVLFSPVLLVLGAAVWWNFGRPIIYTAPRIARNVGTFNAYKLRSMRDLFDENGKLLPDEQRMNRFSRLLRASSLDELPQLWNVIKGEMSLIGPRAMIVDYLPYLRPSEIKRQQMPPGITGWAQVNGRNSLDWDARLEMDVWYVENWSLWLDVKIALMTIPVWLKAQGINMPGYATCLRLDDARAASLDSPPARHERHENALQDG